MLLWISNNRHMQTFIMTSFYLDKSLRQNLTITLKYFFHIKSLKKSTCTLNSHENTMKLPQSPESSLWQLDTFCMGLYMIQWKSHETAKMLPFLRKHIIWHWNLALSCWISFRAINIKIIAMNTSWYTCNIFWKAMNFRIAPWTDWKEVGKTSTYDTTTMIILHM